MGSYGSFDILKSANTGKLIVEGPGGIKYTFSNGAPNENPSIAGSYIKSALDKQQSLLNNAKKSIEQFTEDIKYYQKKLTSEFDKTELIVSLRSESKRLEKLIENQSEQAEAA